VFWVTVLRTIVLGSAACLMVVLFRIRRSDKHISGDHNVERCDAMLKKIWPYIKTIGSIAGLLSLAWKIFVWLQEVPVILVSDPVFSNDDVSFTVANCR
jgi:hypothetical protein